MSAPHVIQRAVLLYIAASLLVLRVTNSTTKTLKHKVNHLSFLRAFAPLWLVILVALSLACGVGQKRSGLPSGAQSAIDTITDDLARGDYEKIYKEAAGEWRQTAKLDESRANLERIHGALGSVLSRAQLGAQEREQASGELAGHTLSVSYNTKFERADAIEIFTLVERSGRWLLARYAVNSNALKQ